MKKILFFLCALVATIAANAAVVTLNPSSLDSITSSATTQTVDGVTLELSNGTINSDQIRVFKNQTLTLSSDLLITRIEFACTASGDAKYGPGCFAPQDGYSYEEKVGVWEGSANAVSFTASTNQVRIVSIVLTLDDNATEPFEMVFSHSIDAWYPGDSAVLNEEASDIEVGKYVFDIKGGEPNEAFLRERPEVLFRMKNSNYKAKAFAIYPDRCFEFGGKNSVIIIRNTRAEDVISLQVAAKGSSDCSFEDVNGVYPINAVALTEDLVLPAKDFDADEADEMGYIWRTLEFKSLGGDVEIKEFNAGYRVRRIVLGEAQQPVDTTVVPVDTTEIEPQDSVLHYSIRLYAPDACPEMKPAVIGTFTNWEYAVPMVETFDADSNLVYTFELDDQPGNAFKFREVNSEGWENEIQYWDLSYGWLNLGNNFLGEETDWIFDFSDNSRFRFSLCDAGQQPGDTIEPQPADTLVYSIRLYAPDACPEMKPAIIGSFNGWSEGIPMAETLDADSNLVYAFELVAMPGDAFKFREVNSVDWENEIQVLDPAYGDWVNLGDNILGEETDWIFDFSDNSLYRFSLCEADPQPIDTTEIIPVEGVPTVEDLAAAGFAVDSSLVLCYKFGGEICDDVVFTGTFNGWSDNPAECAKLQPLEGFDGWYAVEVPFELDSLGAAPEGKPVQLHNGAFEWAYQAGDEWIFRGGNEVVFVDRAPYIPGEVNVAYPMPGAYIYEIPHWKNFSSPCFEANEHIYVLNIYAPDACPDMKLGVTGSFNNWALQAIPMEEKWDEEGKLFYTLTIVTTEGQEYKFKEASDTTIYWENEFLYWDEGIGAWSRFQNFVFPQGTDREIHIAMDFSDNNKYRFTLCDPSNPQPVYTTCAEAVALMPEEAGAETEEVYAVLGYVTEVVGNMSPSRTDSTIMQQRFWMDDERGEAKTLQGYWCNLPGNEALNAGDQIVVTGRILNYNGTAEIKNGDVEILERYVEPIDTTEVEPEVITVAQAIELTLALDTAATTEEDFIVEGYVVNAQPFSVEFANQSWYMADDPDNAAQQLFQAYRCWAVQDSAVVRVLNGDKVRLSGKMTKYYDAKADQIIPEIKQGTATFISMVEGDRSIATEVLPISIAEALAIGENLADNAATVERYELRGFVSAIATDFSEQYGNESFWVTDVQGSTAASNAEGAFYVYRGKPVTGQAIPVGAEVQFVTEIKKYIDLNGNAVIENNDQNIPVEVLSLPVVPEEPYLIRLYAPDACPDMKPAIIGTFTGWEYAVPMNEEYDTDNRLVFTYELYDQPGNAFKFREINDTDWSNEIQFWDADWQMWVNLGDNILGEAKELTFDFSDNSRYRFTLCNDESVYPVLFLDWDGEVLSEQEVRAYSAAVEPEAPVREGYYFIGWSKDYTRVTERVFTIAQYEREFAGNHVVNFVDGVDGSLVDSTVVYLDVPAPYVHEGMFFIGWEVVAGSLENDITIQAVYYDPTLGFDETDAETAAVRKVVREGHLFIQNGQKEYTATGMEVK